MPRNLLSGLRIGEIAFCRSGVHPGAHVLLYKARPDAKPEDLRKEEGEPRSFQDHYEGARAMEIDGAIDRRLYALLDTTTEIMRTDTPDREGLILAAVEAYATTMKADVPELFAGRLAKALEELVGEGAPPNADLYALMKSELEGAGLLPQARNGGTIMDDFLKALTDRGRDALTYVLGGRDPVEVFKGLGEDAQTAVSGLFNKAGEWADRIDALEVDLEKAKQPPADPNSLESILKSIDDPGTRAYVETQAAANAATRKELGEIQKARQTDRLETIVKAWECLPNADDALVVVLRKAEDAEFLAELQPILESANVQARFGKAMEELGVESIPGEGASTTPEEADQALVAKAAEIRKGDSTISPEQAYLNACEANPELYRAARARPAA